MKKIQSFTQKEFLDDNTNLEAFGNHHSASSRYYNSGDYNRRNYNPFTIKYQEMKLHFGKPNFIFDYDDSEIWCIEYNDNLFVVRTDERSGSQIYQKISQRFNITTSESESVYNFYETLMNLLRNREYER